MSPMFRVHRVHDMLLCLPFTDGATKDHFGKVLLGGSPLSVAAQLLCLQHVREVECWEVQGCEVSISVSCNDDSCLASLDSLRTYFTIPTLCFPVHLSSPVRHHPHQYVAKQPFEPSLYTSWRPCTLNCKPLKALYWCVLGV